MKHAMKKILCTLLVMVMCLTVAPLQGFENFGITASALDATGSCGENVTYTYDSTTKALVISGTGAMTNYSYSGTPFYDSDIKSVIIEDGVTSIGDYAFYNCTSLQSVTIGDSVTSIGYRAFYWCTSLASVTIPDSVTSIGDGAFGGCTSLASVTIPDSVTEIGYGAFVYCTSLTSITIPDSVTSIGDEAFVYCTSLESVTIPDSVDAIGEYAFGGCISLTEVIIPAGVTTLGYAAFAQLPFLEKITIKSLGVEIGEHSLCANEFCVSGISREEFALLTAEALKTYYNEELMAELEQYLVFPEEGILWIGTIHCHEGSTAEAYAIENGVDYVLTHFYEGEWIYDYDEMIRYRKCIHCDELEIEPLETTSEGDVEIIEPVDPDTDEVTEEKEGFFAKIIELLEAFFELIMSLFK